MRQRRCQPPFEDLLLQRLPTVVPPSPALGYVARDGSLWPHVVPRSLRAGLPVRAAGPLLRDLRYRNLRLICPNCDSQLATYKARNRGSGRRYRTAEIRRWRIVLIGTADVLTAMIALIGRTRDYICVIEVTVATAAAQLQVSERQVARLARAGELAVTRTVGSALLLDGASVHRWAQRRRRGGRPWVPATAWAALSLLSRERADWLSPSTLSRLRHKLRRADASELSWLVRRRATVYRMRGWGDGTGLLPSGVSALRYPALSTLFGLASVDRGVDGYIPASDFLSLTATLGLVADIDGDMVVRVIPEGAGYKPDNVLEAAVAVDLMSDSLDTREFAAGTRVLQKLLDDFAAGDGRLNRTVNSDAAQHLRSRK